MRFYVSGPRIGFFRPGVIFGAPRWQPRYASAPAAGGYVYVIAGEHGLSKIGISRDPDARLATLRTSSPYRLDLFHVTPAQDAFAVEQEAHAALNQFRANGEWFGVSPQVAVRAVYDAAARVGDSLTHGDMRCDLWPKWLTKNVGYLVWMGIGVLWLTWLLRQVFASP